MSSRRPVDAATRLLGGKHALVTGGGSGIGRATAQAFAREGARVLVSDLVKERAAETVELIRASGGEGTACRADVTCRDDVEAMVAAAAAYGGLDCAFNNAGIADAQAGSVGRKTADWPEEAFDRMMAVNCKGVWLCLAAELRHMAERGSGAIVNTASIASFVAMPTSSAYVAAKHAIVGLTRTAAVEYGRAGIRVNAVAPGYIETGMTADLIGSVGDKVLPMIPMRRVGQPDEVAELVCWLCSDRASYVNGAIYVVDGGYVAR